MVYLTWPDYLILVAFLVMSLGIGIYHYFTGGRQKTISEFIMASRALKALPTTLSLIASFQSAVMILGATAEMYSYGSSYLIMNMMSYTLGFILIMQVIVPWLYPLKLISINEYFELRFKSKLVRILASIFSIFSAIVYMGTVMYAPSAALEAGTGFPVATTIPVMSAVTIAYTALGGMRAVIWTDVFQCITMIGGMVAILIKGLVIVGGFTNVFEFCSQSDRLHWVDWSPDPTVRHTFWEFLFGDPFGWCVLYGLSQASAQRFMATKTLSRARLYERWTQCAHLLPYELYDVFYGTCRCFLLHIHWLRPNSQRRNQERKPGLVMRNIFFGDAPQTVLYGCYLYYFLIVTCLGLYIWWLENETANERTNYPGRITDCVMAWGPTLSVASATSFLISCAFDK